MKLHVVPSSFSISIVLFYNDFVSFQFHFDFRHSLRLRNVLWRIITCIFIKNYIMLLQSCSSINNKSLANEMIVSTSGMTSTVESFSNPICCISFSVRGSLWGLQSQTASPLIVKYLFLVGFIPSVEHWKRVPIIALLSGGLWESITMQVFCCNRYQHVLKGKILYRSNVCAVLYKLDCWKISSHDRHNPSWSLREIMGGNTFCEISLWLIFPRPYIN